MTSATPFDTTVATAPKFYWELEGPQRLVEYAHATVDEGYLANDLIHGAAMLALPVLHVDCPPAVDLPRRLISADVFVNAIAAILQVAASQGHDPVDVAAEACEQQEAVLSLSSQAREGRESRDHLPDRTLHLVRYETQTDG